MVFVRKNKQEFLARRLREERECRRLSRDKLAEGMNTLLQTKIHPQTIVKLELGTMKVTDEWLERFATFYGFPLEVFLREAAAPVPDTPLASDDASARLGPDTFVKVLVGGEDDSALGEVVVKSDHPTLSAIRLGSGAHKDAGHSIFVFNYGDKEPSPRAFYVIRCNGEISCRRYKTNPERWEPYPAGTPDDILYPARPVEVLGRLVEVITRFDP